SRFLQVLPERPIDESHCWEILHPCKAHFLELLKKVGHESERIGATHTCEHWRLLHDGKHLTSHFDNDGIGVSIWHEPGQRSSTRHTISTRIVDNNEVYATCLDTFR